MLDVVLIDARLVLRSRCGAISCCNRAGEAWSTRTSQIVGSSPLFFFCFRAHRSRALNLAPGNSFSSLQEWLRKAVTSPSLALTVFFASLSSALLSPMAPLLACLLVAPVVWEPHTAYPV